MQCRQLGEIGPGVQLSGDPAYFLPSRFPARRSGRWRDTDQYDCDTIAGRLGKQLRVFLVERFHRSRIRPINAFYLLLESLEDAILRKTLSQRGNHFRPFRLPSLRVTVFHLVLSDAGLDIRGVRFDLPALRLLEQQVAFNQFVRNVLAKLNVVLRARGLAVVVGLARRRVNLPLEFLPGDRGLSHRREDDLGSRCFRARRGRSGEDRKDGDKARKRE